MSEPDKVSLDYLLVADGAQVVGGKLYLLGGGWDQLVVPQLPGRPAAAFSVAVGVNMPSSLTNRKMTFSVDVLDADCGHIETLVAGGFEVGRPTGLRAAPRSGLSSPDPRRRCSRRRVATSCSALSMERCSVIP
jgi:hypothetical protein